MVNKIKQAELLARFVHCGQKRRDGEDYKEHCRRVAQGGIDKGEAEENICARWLHDVLEECEPRQKATIFDMIRAYFPPKVEGLVLVLTHSKKINTYNEYIGLVSQYPEALIIKFDDMIDNTSCDIPARQRAKYQSAYALLQSKGYTIPQILKERLLIK